MSSRLLRNALALFLGLLLGGAATWASAVDGFSYRDKCYPTVLEAIQSFASTFPQVIGQNMVVYAETTWTAPDNPDFTYATYYYDSNGQWVPQPSNAGAFQICTVPEDVSTLVPNNFILVCVAVLLWAIGLNTGMKR